MALANKFHINSKGVASACMAKKGKCPFGGSSGEENHYDSYEEAQAEADKKLESEYGILYQKEKGKTVDDLDGYVNEEVKENSIKFAAQVTLEGKNYGKDASRDTQAVLEDYADYVEKQEDGKEMKLYEFYQKGIEDGDYEENDEVSYFVEEVEGMATSQDQKPWAGSKDANGVEYSRNEVMSIMYYQASQFDY